MATVVKLEDLRAATAEVTIVLDNLVRTFSRTELISCTVDKGDREIEVLKHSVLSEERPNRIVEPAAEFQTDEVLFADPLKAQSIHYAHSVAPGI